MRNFRISDILSVVLIKTAVQVRVAQSCLMMMRTFKKKP
jgi:hypothetical protein